MGAILRIFGYLQNPKLYFLPKFCFTYHHFLNRNARKSIKGSRLVLYPTVQQTFDSKNLGVGAQGPVKMAKNT